MARRLVFVEKMVLRLAEGVIERIDSLCETKANGKKENRMEIIRLGIERELARRERARARAELEAPPPEPPRPRRRRPAARS